jgi:hypothetical protein
LRLGVDWLRAWLMVFGIPDDGNPLFATQRRDAVG